MGEKRQSKSKLTRRSLLGSAVALGGGGALTTLAAPVGLAAPAVIGSKREFHPLVASPSRNVVETDAGKLYGYSRDGVSGYRGIPYGGSTEGKNRFMPPTSVTPWAGARSALYWSWASPSGQNATIKGRRASWAHDDESFMFEWDDGQPSEDCLRLNVWTPGLDNKKRAVMFWIHGGGMIFGSSNELRAYDGENLARTQDVVVVSLNHRLGVLGFLDLRSYGEQYASSPNVSMLDIIAALGWVKTNISNFGGDPGRVMIFGQSGGGAKVGTIMGMPAAKGLFHRASIQSGSGLTQGATEISSKLADTVIAELGLDKNNIAKIHTDFTLHQLEEAALVGQLKASSGLPPTLPGERGMNWQPVVDGKLIPRNTWVPSAPNESADVPLMVGSVMNENFNSVQMGDASLEQIDRAAAEKLLNRFYGTHTAHVLDVTQQLYPGATPFEIFSRSGAMRERINACRQADLKTRQGVAPAYLYRFEWQSPMCDRRARAFHTSELPFCFNNAALCAKISGNTPEAHALADHVSGAWAAFAKTGNPNHPGIPRWTAYNDGVPTMRFNTECIAGNDPDAELRKAVQEAMA